MLISFKPLGANQAKKEEVPYFNNQNILRVEK